MKEAEGRKPREAPIAALGRSHDVLPRSRPGRRRRLRPAAMVLLGRREGRPDPAWKGSGGGKVLGLSTSRGSPLGGALPPHQPSSCLAAAAGAREALCTCSEAPAPPRTPPVVDAGVATSRVLNVASVFKKEILGWVYYFAGIHLHVSEKTWREPGT